jgi:polysaccharide biosynthesis/export protein
MAGVTRSRRGLPRRLPLLVLIALAGCTIPRGGPMLSEMQAGARRGAFMLTVPTQADADASRVAVGSRLPEAWTRDPDLDFDRLGIGDRIDVTIRDQSGTGLFAPPGQAGLSDLGEFTIDRTGRILLPYVGAVPVAGQDEAQARIAIAARFARLAADAQVGVRLIERRSRSVSLEGDAAKPGTYQLDHGLSRLSQLLALAAVNTQSPEMLAVSVRRGARIATARLADLYDDPAGDLALRPDDRVVVRALTPSITVLGAAGLQARLSLPRRNLSVVEALGLAHGLNDQDADPRGVFLLRPAAVPGGLATVFRFEMNRPEQLLVAQRFAVADGDALVVADAPFVQTRKLLSAFSATLSTTRSATTFAQ